MYCPHVNVLKDVNNTSLTSQLVIIIVTWSVKSSSGDQRIITPRGGSRILHEWFAPTKLGGFGGMLPQENLKFSALKLPFSCVLRAPQAIQTHKQYLLQKGIILYKYSLLCLTIQGNIFLSRSELCLSVSKGSSKWISIDKSVDKPTRLLQFAVE